MNVIRKPSRQEREIAAIREIVARHPLPDFITGFDVRLGEFDGDPAMWVVYHMRDDGWSLSREELGQQVAEMNALSSAVMRDLLDVFEDRFPYFRFEPAAPPGPNQV